MIVRDILEYIDGFAPFNTAEDFDNVGLLIGDINRSVSKMLICLDVTREVLSISKEKSIDLILSHHPIIFNPLRKVLYNDLVYSAIKSGVSVICAHTNLDRASFGVAFCLAKAIGLKDVEILKNSGDFARIGNLEKAMFCEDFIDYISFKLNSFVRAVYSKKQIKRVAVAPGSGCFALNLAIKEKADAFITGEAKHEILLMAKEKDFCFIDASHFATENVVCVPLAKKIEDHFKDRDLKVFVFEGKAPVEYVFGDKIWD